MRLTHRQIEVFRAVMASGHVTRAAEYLGSSQPTVSREIAHLERTLNLELFERVRGRLRPSVRALALLEEVERSFVGLDRIAAVAVGLREFAQGRLSLACLPALAHALLPDAVRHFAEARPLAAVSISTHDSPRLERELSEQRFDLGLVEVSEAPVGTTLTPLLTDNEVAVLPAGHPLLARRRLAPRDFEGLSFVSLAPTDPYRHLADAAFECAGVTRRLAIDADSAIAVCALVRKGLGVGIVNPLTAVALAGNGLHIRPLAFPIPFRIGVVVPEIRPRSPLAPAFEQALVKATSDLHKSLARLARA